MSWNYRLCKKIYLSGTPDEEIELSIREVYYHDDGSISGYTANPVAPYSQDIDGMKWVLEKMREALDKEIVDLDSLEKNNNMRLW